MQSKKRLFNSSLADSWSFDENSFRRRRPKPSNVNIRLELAREKPVNDNPELERLMYHKKLLLSSNASEQELKTLEHMIKLLEAKATKEHERYENDVDGKARKEASKTSKSATLKLNDSTEDVVASEKFLEESFNRLNLSTEASTEKSKSADTAPEVAASHSVIYKRQRIPNHLKNLMSASSSDKDSQSNNCLENKSKEMAFTNYRHPRADYGNYLRSLLPDCKPDSSRQADKNMDDDIDALTVKLENTRIVPITQRKYVKCICNRKVLKSQCMACRAILNGRVFRRCEYHPKVVFTEDLYNCSECGANITQLIEVDDEA